MSALHTVPWHPDFDQMPGWLVFATRVTCMVIRDEGGGLLPERERLRRGVNRMFATYADRDGLREIAPEMMAGLLQLCIEFDFIARVGNAPGGSA